ncbi:MAG: hypothetical protein CSA55_02325 [Ilumatobacter coccineus]|uniref:Transglutaminase-like domain-containing protein n=1 Tax=Ilumatobacter coccineus TaxID=467094 RepID=A0A2G6KBI7_9ACTN|nr:MAG: hypothetical protein CSA55_02325 [Ilumatobacter coccineus]
MTSRRFHELAASGYLIVFHLVVAAFLLRVFDDTEMFRSMATLIVVGHLVTALMRLSPLPSWLSILTSALSVAWLSVLTVSPATTWWTLPTAATWHDWVSDLRALPDELYAVTPPVAFDAGWAVVATLAIALAVVVSDGLAFRARAKVEPLVPGLTIVVVVIALGIADHRPILPIVLVFVSVITIAGLRWFHATEHLDRTTSQGSRSWTPIAIIATASAVAALAGVVGPRLPGAQAGPILNTSGEATQRVTRIASPLVDIRSRLTERQDREVFQVISAQPAYWRLTTLSEFDGSTFQLAEESIEEIGDAQLSPEDIFAHTVTIVDLPGHLVPVAAEPRQASGQGADGSVMVRQGADTGAFVVTERTLKPGDVFTLVSQRPALDPDRLRSVGSANPPLSTSLDLPSDLPPSVVTLTRELVADAPTGYDAALALQNWFRSEFEYSLTVEPGHDIDAITTFLDERVGYCEQFAVTYAAMARTVGLPSRVAVGYTSGDRDEAGVYHVKELHAHAWPEIWFDDVGWVPFEPTPGRGDSTTSTHTGVEPAQATGEPSTTIPVTIPVQESGDNTPRSTLTPAAPSGPPPSPAPSPPPSHRRLWWSILGFGIVAIAVMAPEALRRMNRSRHARRSPSDRIERDWTRALRSLNAVGMIADPSMTPAEIAASTGVQFPSAHPLMVDLAAIVERHLFGPNSPQRDQTLASLADTADTITDKIDSLVAATLTRSDRLRRYLTEWN